MAVASARLISAEARRQSQEGKGEQCQRSGLNSQGHHSGQTPVPQMDLALGHNGE